MLDSQRIASQQLLLGKRIKLLRIKAGFNSQVAFDKAYKEAYNKLSNISRIERGANIELRTIVCIGNILQMPIYCFVDFSSRFKIQMHERYNYNVDKRLQDVLNLIGKNVKKVRTAKGMSQLDMEVASEIDRGNLSGIELGQENLKFDTVLILAYSLNVEVWELFKD